MTSEFREHTAPFSGAQDYVQAVETFLKESQSGQGWLDRVVRKVKGVAERQGVNPELYARQTILSGAVLLQKKVLETRALRKEPIPAQDVYDWLTLEVESQYANLGSELSVPSSKRNLSLKQLLGGWRVPHRAEMDEMAATFLLREGLARKDQERIKYATGVMIESLDQSLKDAREEMLGRKLNMDAYTAPKRLLEAIRDRQLVGLGEIKERSLNLDWPPFKENVSWYRKTIQRCKDYLSRKKQ